MKRSFIINYTHSEGRNEVQFDIEDRAFDEMMNELIRLLYMVTDESGERNVEIESVEEVPYNGEEE